MKYLNDVSYKDCVGKMSKIGVCLGGRDCGKSIVANLNEVNINNRDGHITTYKRVSLKIIKSIHGNVSSRSFLLNPPLDIYVPVEDYDNYEGALKLILNSFINAEWTDELDDEQW